MVTRISLRALLLALPLLGACATVQNSLVPPQVSLRSVQVERLDFRKQTFLLAFDVTNPNPVSLPIKSVSYGVKLDGISFASGETSSNFSIPAGGDTEFTISANLDLLNTAPALLAIVRDATHSSIPYQLDGALGVDIPFVKPLTFSTNGEIRVSARGY
ncbi:MAG: LEA type 2 family protein [Woeseiaceae bacterium]